MDIGIKDAKNNLSNLVAQARTGTRIFLTNRGERMVELVPVKDVKAPAPERGLGWLKSSFKDLCCSICKLSCPGPARTFPRLSSAG